MIGAFKLNSIGKFTVSAVAEVIRKKKGIVANNNAQISTAQSKFGGASALFDGTGDYLTVEKATEISTTQDWTIEFWMRATNFTGYPGIMRSATISSKTGWAIQCSQTNGAVQWIGSLNGTSDVAVLVNSGAVSSATWTHIAFVHQSGVIKCYKNGTLGGTSSTLTTLSNPTDIIIGDGAGISSGNFVDSTDYNGYLDEIRISKTARYTANFTEPTAPFVNDDNTLLLIHADGTNASTFFEDDNGVRGSKGIQALGNAQIATVQSKFGATSAYFDGTGDYLEISKSADLTLTSQSTWTIEMWVRFANVGVLRGLICQQTGGNVNNYGWGLYRDASNRLLWYSGGGTFVTTSGWTSAANTWYHVAVVRNGTSLKMFVDGTQYYTTSSYSNSTDSAANIVIGFARDYASNLWSTVIFYQSGYIDELRISNSARYTANFTAPTSAFTNDANTVLLMHMDGSEGYTTFRDDNGSRASISCRSNNYVGTSITQSKFGGASAYFDGSGIVYCSGDFTKTGDFTFECWVRRSSITGTQGIICIGNEATGRQLLRSNGAYFQLDGYNTSGVDILQTSTTFSANTWYHLAVVRSGSTVTLYQNGTSIGSASYSSTFGNSSNLTIGSDASGFYIMTGYVDEVRISTVARYTGNFTAPTAAFQNDSSTQLLLHMDGSDGVQNFYDDNGKTPT